MPQTPGTVTLRTISGKTAVVASPVTYATLLAAAVSGLGFAPASVKVQRDGRIVRPAILAAAQLSSSVSAAPGTGSLDLTSFGGYRKEREGGVSIIACGLPASARPAGGPGGADRARTTALTGPSPPPAAASRAGRATAGTAPTSSPAPAASPTVTTPTAGAITRSPGPPKTVRDVVSGAVTSRAAVAQTSAASSATPRAAHAILTAGFPGPLPYPHCPQGLREMRAIVAPASTADTPSAAPAAAAPAGPAAGAGFDMRRNRVLFTHPTMRFIAETVRNDRTTLRDVLEQIYQANPPLYRWIADNQGEFLYVLNSLMANTGAAALEVADAIGQLQQDLDELITTIMASLGVDVQILLQEDVHINYDEHATEEGVHGDGGGPPRVHISFDVHPDGTVDARTVGPSGVVAGLPRRGMFVTSDDEDDVANPDDEGHDRGEAEEGDEVNSDFVPSVDSDECWWPFNMEDGPSESSDGDCEEHRGEGRGVAGGAGVVDAAPTSPPQPPRDAVVGTASASRAEPSETAAAVQVAPAAASSPVHAPAPPRSAPAAPPAPRPTAISAGGARAPRAGAPTPPVGTPHAAAAAMVEAPMPRVVRPGPPAPRLSLVDRGRRLSAAAAATASSPAASERITVIGEAPAAASLAPPVDAVLRGVDASMRSASHLADHADASGAAEDARAAHVAMEAASDALLQELARSLVRIENTADYAWLVRAAVSRFYPRALEFYLSLVERGTRDSLMGPSVSESLPALAFKAALGRQLFIAADALVQRCGAMAAAVPSPGGCQRFRSRSASSSGHVGLSTGGSSCSAPAAPDGPPNGDWGPTAATARLGGLFNLPADCSPLMDPATRWMSPSGPDHLLRELLETLTAHPSTSDAASETAASPVSALSDLHGGSLLWLDGHAYSSAAAHRGRLAPAPPLTSILAFVLNGAGPTAGSITVRRLTPWADAPYPCLIAPSSPSAWSRASQRAYETLVQPVVDVLPPAHTSVRPVYVIDTRMDVFTVKDGIPVGGSGCVAGARAFAAYRDADGVSCLDKWCVTAALRLWDVQLAADVALLRAPLQDGEAPLTVLADETADAASAPSWLSAELREALQARVEAATVAASSGPRHVCILHESASKDSVGGGGVVTTMAAAAAAAHVVARARSRGGPSPRPSLSYNGLAPLLSADLHVIEGDDGCGGAANAQLAVGHRATLVTNHTDGGHGSNSSSSSGGPAVSMDAVFYHTFYSTLATNPGMPLAAAARAASLRVVETYEAPWAAASHSLLNYGGPMGEAFTAALRKALPPPPSAPVSPPPPAVATFLSYASAHGLNDLYEMMLSDLMQAEPRPSTEAGVLDQLIGFVKSNEATMREAVASAATAASSAAPAPATSAPSSAEVLDSWPTPVNVVKERDGKGAAVAMYNRPSAPQPSPMPPPPQLQPPSPSQSPSQTTAAVVRTPHPPPSGSRGATSPLSKHRNSGNAAPARRLE